MVLHIAIMNLLAPLAAALLAAHTADGGGRRLRTFAVAQAALLWLWRAPALQRLTLDSQLLQVTMHASLLSAAFGFWTALVRIDAGQRWHAVASLLITAKLSCLPAVLLIFAPRPLYHSQAHRHAKHTSLPAGLEDQQLAGLVMVSACPLSYVVAGIIVAAQMLHRLGPDATHGASLRG